MMANLPFSCCSLPILLKIALTLFVLLTLSTTCPCLALDEDLKVVDELGLIRALSSSPESKRLEIIVREGTDPDSIFLEEVYGLQEKRWEERKGQTVAFFNLKQGTWRVRGDKNALQSVIISPSDRNHTVSTGGKQKGEP